MTNCGLRIMCFFFCLTLCAASGQAQWVKDGVPFCVAAGSQYNTKAIPDGRGGAFVAWTDTRAMTHYDIYCNRIDAQGSLTGPLSGIAVCTAPGEQTETYLVPDGTGGGIIVWRDHRAGYRAYAQRIDGTGAVRWTPNGIALCGETASQMLPRIAPDGGDGAFIAWSDQRSGNYDVYIQHVDADGNLLFGASGAAMCTATGSQLMRDMAADGSGGAVIVWADERGSSTDVYAQRFNSAGVALWTADGVAVCTDDGDQNYMKIIPSGGGAIIAWEGPGFFATQDIFAAGLDADGNIVWGGIPVSYSQEYKWGTYAVTDGAGGAIVAFYVNISGSDIPHIYAQRIDSSGNAYTWGGYGVCVFPTGGEGDLCIVSDGAGGAIVALDAYYEESWYYSHIYAQRLDPSGNLLWITPRGTGVCTAVNDQYSPALCSDGEGGALFTWEDNRNDEAALYAQRVCAEGLWGIPEPAIVSCRDLPGDQGGWVTVGVRASSHDIAEERDYPIAGYNVWRAKIQLDPPALLLSVATGASGADADEASTAEPEIAAGLESAAGRVAGIATELTAGIAAELEKAVELKNAAQRARLIELFAEPAELAGVTLSRDQALLLGFPGGEWESVAYQFATQDTLYDIAAPTRNDSTEAGNAREVFVVTAHTTTPSAFLISQPDTAWSVDNIAPVLTAGFRGNEIESPHGLELLWTPNSAPDLWKYDVYRGADSLFVPGGSNLLGTTRETTYFDPTWAIEFQYYYKLVAVDRHGNGSPAALLRPDDINTGTMLQSFAASRAGSVVEIAWTLAEASAEVSFAVLRAEALSGSFEELASAAIARDGLSFSMRDKSCEPGMTYRYRVDLFDEAGRRVLFETDVISIPAMPLTLHQNHPNPFNPSTVIGYYVPAAGVVTLDVYDPSGRLVARLIDGERQTRGMHSIEWRGVDSDGRPVGSGVYFYRLTSGKETVSRKMVLLR